MATKKTSKKPSAKAPVAFLHGGLAKARAKIDLREVQTKEEEEQIQIEFANTDLQTKRDLPLTDLKLQAFPGQIRGEKLQLKVPLSRHTPPGTHEADIIINGQKRKAVFEVEERMSVNIKPNRFFIEAAAGSQLEKVIYVTNHGNVPVVFPDPGPVMLESRHLECRAIREVVHKIDKKNANLDRVIGLFAEKLEELYEEASALKVRLNGKAPSIAPGATEKITLKIQLPSNLRRPHQYSGSYRFYNALILFTILPGAAKNNPR